MYPRDIFGHRTEVFEYHPSAGWAGADVWFGRVAGNDRLELAGSTSWLDHTDAVGTTTMQTDPTGAETWDATHYPWGQVWQQTGSHPTGGFYADLEFAINDPLIPSATREYNPGFYRWMTPDPGGRKVVKLSNPQTWNMYAYALDNPTSLNDPSGLDIWLKGCGKESVTCHNDFVGHWNSHHQFVRKHLSGNQTKTATLGRGGIKVKLGNRTYEGVWDTNPGQNSTVWVRGTGDLSGFHASVTGNCGGTCVAKGALLQPNATGPLNSNPVQAGQVRASLQGESGWLANPFDIFHWRNGTPDISFVGHPTPGPSVSIPVPRRPADYGVNFHVNALDWAASPKGFGVHVVSIGHTVVNWVF